MDCADRYVDRMDMPHIRERRRWLRTALESPENVSLCYTDSAGKLQLIQVLVRDASDRGLGVISPLALPVGSCVSAGGSVNTAPVALSARRAAVASCRALEDGTFIVGLAYEQLGEGAKSGRLEGLGIWHSAAHGQTLYVNQPMCEMLQIVSWEDLGAKTYESFLRESAFGRKSSFSYSSDIGGMPGPRAYGLGL